MIRLSAICFLVLFSASTLFAGEVSWPPNAPNGWMQTGVTFPQKATGCSGDLSAWPEMKAICEGTANETWTAVFMKFDVKAQAITNVNMTLFKDGSAGTYYFYCGAEYYKGYDPTAGFKAVNPDGVKRRAQACFK